MTHQIVTRDNGAESVTLHNILVKARSPRGFYQVVQSRSCDTLDGAVCDATEFLSNRGLLDDELEVQLNGIG